MNNNIDIDKRLDIVNHPLRPNAIDYINYIFPDFIELHGDRLFGDDVSIVGGIASLAGQTVTIIGQIRGRNLAENIKYNFSMSHPEGFRKSLRLMKQAEKFKRPVVCFVDTIGAYPGVEAESRGQSAAIANSLMEMMGLKVPVFSFLIGNGGSGGALALLVANEIIMLENSVLSVISPKGCASILWKDIGRHAEAAEILKMTAEDISRMGLVDAILEEPTGGAHVDMYFMSMKIKAHLEMLLKKYSMISQRRITKTRYKKHRNFERYID